MYFRSKRILIKDNLWMLLACYKGNFFHVKPIPPTHRSVGHNKSCIRRWTLCWNLGCLCFTKSTQISTQSLYQNERLSKKNRYPASVCYLWHNFSLSMRSYVASAAMWAAAHNPPVIVNQAKWHGKKERKEHLFHMFINVESFWKRIIWKKSTSSRTHYINRLWTNITKPQPQSNELYSECLLNRNFIFGRQELSSICDQCWKFVAGCFCRQKWFSPLREIITASLHD